MKIKADVENVTFICAEVPVAVIDPATGVQRADRNGEPVFSVRLALLTEGASEMLAVKISGQPKGLSMGDRVKVSGLIGSTWEIEGRSGVSFRAEKIEPVGPPVAPSPAAAAAASGKSA